ncbi:translation initiation factor IF-2 [Sunxiuqinia dokdonensis]|uniref:Translation initiation factor IF-2 n=1 Tax=Sunxiuqinia dokdonensis TaxID=1409788 RepID=A0A0L8V8G6_9BACT|nr:translation initiation factor IF-2 [Sunxiuqinia dokdonensis]KOH44741.1 translation initiation factor IF-2 [Sunxiuqinia dokdonensis]
MAIGKKSTRLSKVAREFNVGTNTIVEFLHKKGFDIDANPNSKISEDAYHMLEKEYKSDITLKKESEKINLMSHRSKNESISLENANADTEEDVDQDDEEEEVEEVRIKDMNPPKKETPKAKPEPKPQPEEEKEKLPEVDQPKVLGKIDLDSIQPKKREGKPTVIKKGDQKQEEPKAAKPKEEEKQIETPKAEVSKPVEPKPVPEEEKPAEVEKQTEPIEEVQTNIPKVDEVKVVGRIDLSSINQKTRPTKKTKKQKEDERKERDKQKRQTSQEQGRDRDKDIKTNVEKLSGPNVVGKIDIKKKKPVASSTDTSAQNAKKKRRRIQKDSDSRINVVKPGQGQPQGQGQRGRMQQQGGKGKRKIIKKEVSEEDVQKQIKDTLARLTSGKQKSKGSKYRRDKRQAASDKASAAHERESAEQYVLKVTEFVSVSELATMMDVSVTEVISSCMSLGLFVSINQRLDAETMSIVAEEFGYEVEFVSADILDGVDDDDEPEQVHPRAPIVTVMGHVDHGKTSLLDHIRSANVIAGEAGGITQHIGAYHVSLADGRMITFLDTPGHEAFTAMRARGAQVTDIAIIIVAADDDIMPQTKEAINHAQAAGVPIVFAINKIDKPNANPDKIKEGLANLNFLVEEWGGKYQSQDISAKNGVNIDELLEKVLLEAEMLELKGNKDRRATGTIVESSLDRGRGYVATVLVQNGTLHQGDIMLAGKYYGHIKAMFNERNQRIESAGPSEPVIILGLDGAPQAGDKFNVFENEREARQIANKREQLAREQGLRTQKHITLDEIGRRIAIGNFQELNLIVKGDVDGSIEALSDALIKLSTDEIQVNVIHKAVGAISESDVMLATASDAIVVGFQVRPSMQARKLAEKEEVDIRLYSIIYDAINEIKSAMEGMLSPEIKEEILGTAEVMEAFKITKVGTIAGCIVRDGKIHRNNKVRLIRDGIVIYTGTLGSLKRFKDDVKEVQKGYECGLNIDGYNDVKEGDMIEAFHEIEVAKSL